MAAKSTKSKTTGKRRIRTAKKPSSNKKTTRKTTKRTTGKEKLPAGNQPEMVIVF